MARLALPGLITLGLLRHPCSRCCRAATGSCHGALGIAEVDRGTGVDGEPGVVGDLVAKADPGNQVPGVALQPPAPDPRAILQKKRILLCGQVAGNPPCTPGNFTWMVLIKTAVISVAAVNETV